MQTRGSASQQSGQLWFYRSFLNILSQSTQISITPSPPVRLRQLRYLRNFNRRRAQLCHSRRMLIHPPGRISGDRTHMWELSQSLSASLADSPSLCLSTYLCVGSTGLPNSTVRPVAGRLFLFHQILIDPMIIIV